MTARPGPKSLYKVDEEAWLAPVIEEFLGLVERKSDPLTLKEFKKEKTEDFLKEFETQLVAVDRNLEDPPVTNIESWRSVSGISCLIFVLVAN